MGNITHQLSSPAKSCQCGFTLLELMVVVTIIGIILTYAGLSIEPQSDQRLQNEAKRIHQLIKLASDEAIIQSRNYALQITPLGYEFLVRGDEVVDGKVKYIPFENDKLFRKRELDQDIKVTLEIEGQPVEFEEDKPAPYLHITASGEMTPFRLTFAALYGKNQEYVIENTTGANVNYETPNEGQQENAGWSF